MPLAAIFIFQEVIDFEGSLDQLVDWATYSMSRFFLKLSHSFSESDVIVQRISYTFQFPSYASRIKVV